MKEKNLRKILLFIQERSSVARKGNLKKFILFSFYKDTYKLFLIKVLF